MAGTVKVSQAQLERLVEQRLRAASDDVTRAPGTAPNGGAINVRPGTEQDSSNAPGGPAWRGSRNPYSERQSNLTEEQAGHVLGFFRGLREGDRQQMRSSMERLQQVGVSTDGGYTVPTQFVAEVLIDLPKVTPFADSNIVRIVPMDSETMQWTKVVSRPSQPGYVAEGTSYSKSGVTFAPITLVAKKIGEIIPFTEEIMRSNKIAMVQVISSLVADAFAFKYNALITSGNGDATEPEGVLTNPNVATVAWVATDDRTRADSIIDTYHGIASQYRLETIWLMNDATVKLCRKLKDTQGRYLWVDGFGPTPSTLLGRPVFENPDLPTSNILFGNFRRGYVIGKRDGMAVDQNSSGTDWEKDIVNFKFRERWDGRVHDEKAFCVTTGVA